MQFADYLVHISNIMLLVSYSVRDILWLRCSPLALRSSTSRTFLSRERALATGSLGTRIIAINLYQITRIYLERRPVVLSEDERKLYDLGFRSLRQREFVRWRSWGEWKSAGPARGW